MIVVGICGRLNSGKNAAAKIFHDHGGFSEMALADPIKDILHKYFRVPKEELWGPSETRTERTRKMLQVLGTDFGRAFYPTVWVDYLADRLDSMTDHSRVVVTDVRFPNEAELIIAKGGYLIKVVRPSVSRVTEENTHESEMQVDAIPDDMFRRIIMNDSTLPAFKKRVLKVMKEILNAAS